jgi:hypothetical protein
MDVNAVMKAPGKSVKSRQINEALILPKVATLLEAASQP